MLTRTGGLSVRDQRMSGDTSGTLRAHSFRQARKVIAPGRLRFCKVPTNGGDDKRYAALCAVNSAYLVDSRRCLLDSNSPIISHAI